MQKGITHNVNPITANQPCGTSVQVEPDISATTFTLNTRTHVVLDKTAIGIAWGHHHLLRRPFASTYATVQPYPKVFDVYTNNYKIMNIHD